MTICAAPNGVSHSEAIPQHAPLCHPAPRTFDHEPAPGALGLDREVQHRLLVESPSQENADRYRWLATQQTELLRIRTGAISRWTLIGVISLNIYIVSISLAYPFLKYRIGLDEIHQWFNRVFLP